MNIQERQRYLNVKRERDLLRSQLSTAVDKQLLLLNQVIDLQNENRQLRAMLEANHES